MDDTFECSSIESSDFSNVSSIEDSENDENEGLEDADYRPTNYQKVRMIKLESGNIIFDVKLLLQSLEGKSEF